jgi:hypothetical protein
MSRGASATRYGDIRVCVPHIATRAALRATRGSCGLPVYDDKAFYLRREITKDSSRNQSPSCLRKTSRVGSK